jgi:hypothetical protein
MNPIVQWVLRTMMKGQTGVMRTLPDKKLLDFNVNMTIERLLKNNVDPSIIKTPDQLDNIIKQIEAPRNVQQGIKSTKSAKVFDLEGKEIDPKKGIMGGKQIDDDLPPPGSRGGKDDIAAPIQSGDESLRDMIEAEIKKKIEKQNKKAAKKLKDRKRLEDRAIEDFVDDAGGTNPDDPRGIDDFIPDPEDMAQGGRAGFKEGSGMTRRSFLKILGGLAAIPIVGKFLKPIKTAKGIKSVPIIKTDNVPGKPEWFDALVNKVIAEGDDVTKKFATQERQIVHSKDLGDGTTVRVTQDTDQGAVRVEYESEQNVFGDPVQMEYRKPLPDEGDPRPAAEFGTAESGPVGRQTSPDDFELEVDEIGGSSISDLDSDVSKLKEYATGKGPTMREIIQNKKRRDKAARITDDIDGAASDAAIRRQGEYYPDEDGLASGGIARMLGE